MSDQYSEGYEAGLNRADMDSGQVIDALLAENARLREQAEALAGALEDIQHGAASTLRAYREPWATVHTKYLDDQLVERCITCLERWPCKEDKHDDRR